MLSRHGDDDDDDDLFLVWFGLFIYCYAKKCYFRQTANVSETTFPPL